MQLSIIRPVLDFHNRVQLVDATSWASTNLAMHMLVLKFLQSAVTISRWEAGPRRQSIGGFGYKYVAFQWAIGLAEWLLQNHVPPDNIQQVG